MRAHGVFDTPSGDVVFFLCSDHDVQPLETRARRIRHIITHEERLMPTHKACAKHLRASARRNLRNRDALTELRTAIKRVRLAKNKTEAAAALRDACSCIDKCTKTGLLHRNNAANKKSRLSIFVNKLSAAK